MLWGPLLMRCVAIDSAMTRELYARIYIKYWTVHARICSLSINLEHRIQQYDCRGSEEYNR